MFILRGGVDNMPIPQKKKLIIRPISAIRPSSVTENLRGGGLLYHLGLKNVTAVTSTAPEISYVDTSKCVYIYERRFCFPIGFNML